MKAEWRDVCEGHASGTSQQVLPSISLVLIRQGSLVSGSHSIYVAEKIIYVGSRVGLLGITWDERLAVDTVAVPSALVTSSSPRAVGSRCPFFWVSAAPRPPGAESRLAAE